MANEYTARLLAHTPLIDVKAPVRVDAPRRHVLNRLMQEKSGRLYCNEDYDFDIPTLELYAAR
jgi:hypothetical protein